MSEEKRPLSPHLQVYRWQITTVLSILHRITGIAFALGMALLTAWLIAAAAGPQTFAMAEGLIASPLGLLVLLGFSFALFFHLCNGIRHLFWDYCIGFELTTATASGWAVIAASVLLTALAWVIGS
ncbi:MAG: succinate dehydrogenase, cytochrome b556 subunit [Alphaproteobacteria bacterium]